MIRVYDYDGSYIETFADEQHMYESLNRRYRSLQKKREKELRKQYNKGYWTGFLVAALIAALYFFK